MKKKFGVLLPAYNEEENIGKTLEILKKSLSEYEGLYKVLVVDDGSTDKTAVKSLEKGAGILKYKENRGKGPAVMDGLEKLLEDPELKHFVVMDADGEIHPDYVPEFFEKLTEGVGAVFGWGKNKGKFSKLLNKVTGYDESWGTGIMGFDRELTDYLTDCKAWDYIRWNISALTTFAPYKLSKEVEHVELDMSRGVEQVDNSKFKNYERLLGLPIAAKILIHGLEEKLRSL